MPPPVPSLPTPALAEPGLVDPLLHLLFTECPLCVGVMELQGDDVRHLAVNPATAARMGLSVEAIRGKTARELGIPAEASAAWARLAALALRRGAPASAEWQVSRERGVASFRSTVVPLPAPPHAAPRFAYLTEELTRVRTLERRLQGTEAPTKALAADVEQPLAHALHVLDVAGDEVETLAATHPELELADAADALRDGIRDTRRAHQKLRDLLRG
jgi:PAS fold